jgi:hypothetical protein
MGNEDPERYSNRKTGNHQSLINASWATAQERKLASPILTLERSSETVSGRNPTVPSEYLNRSECGDRLMLEVDSNWPWLISNRIPRALGVADDLAGRRLED